MRNVLSAGWTLVLRVVFDLIGLQKTVACIADEDKHREICTSGLKRASSLLVWQQMKPRNTRSAHLFAAQTVSQHFQQADVYNQSFNVQQRFGNRDISEGSICVCVLADPLDREPSIIIGCAAGDVVLTLCHQWADWNSFWHLLQEAGRQRSAAQFRRTWKFFC